MMTDRGPRCLTRPAIRAFSYFLTASLIFAPAILVSPLTWSPRPSAFSRGLPEARPAVFLTLPLTASALCAIFLKILMGDTFRGFILLALTRQPGQRERPCRGGVPAGARRAARGPHRPPGRRRGLLVHRCAHRRDRLRPRPALLGLRLVTRW